MTTNFSAFSIPALLALTISACGPDSALGEQPTLTGQIESWDLGSGFMLQGTVEKTDVDFWQAIVLTTTPIDAAGTFRIVLPSRDAMAPFLLAEETANDAPAPPGCTGGAQYNPTLIAINELTFRVVNGTTILGPLLHLKNRFAASDRTSLEAKYFYSAREYTEIGTVRCPQTLPDGSASQTEEKADIHFLAGWNRPLQTFSSPENGPIRTSFVTGPLPEEVKWWFFP